MKITRLFAVAALSLFATFASAHEEFEITADPIVQAQAIEIATGQIGHLVEQGKLNASWVGKEPATAKRDRKDGVPTWIVSFVDEKNKKSMNIVLNDFGAFQSFSTADL
jgi:hypothetical protein